MSDKYDLFYFIIDRFDNDDDIFTDSHSSGLEQLGFIKGNMDEYNDQLGKRDPEDYKENFGIPEHPNDYYYSSYVDNDRYPTQDKTITLYITPKGKTNILGYCKMILKYYERRNFENHSDGLSIVYIQSICVLEKGFKSIGSLLLTKIKEFAKNDYHYLGVPMPIDIIVTVHPREHSFYIKHGFIVKPGLGDIIFEKILLLSRIFLEQTGFKIKNLEESKDPTEKLEEMVYNVYGVGLGQTTSQPNTSERTQSKTSKRTQSKTSKRTQSKTSKRTNRTMSKSIKI
jgi:hypothetical protein